MFKRFVSVRHFAVAGILGGAALLAGCCGNQMTCAPVAPTCTPVVGSVAVAYQAAPVAVIPAVTPAAKTVVVQQPVIIVSANPERDDRTARAKAAVAAATVQAKPAAPAATGGSAQLDAYERPENFKLVYPGLSPSELAHYGVGNHLEIAEPDFADVTPLD